MEIRLQEITDSSATIAWEPEDGAECYRVYWADSDTPSMEYRRLAETAWTAPIRCIGRHMSRII